MQSPQLYGQWPTWLSKAMLEEYNWDFKNPNNAKDNEQRERVRVLRAVVNKEITAEQGREMQAQITKKYHPEVSSDAPIDPNGLLDEKDDNWTDLGPHWGERRSKEDEPIPASAKAVTKHRSACGMKLSDKDIARFWSKINVKGANECWNWKQSTRGSLGYGQFRIEDKICDAHRVALELMKGPLKKGRYVCHSCDSPKCCNPRHLFAGTQKNNMDDMTDKGRGDN